MSALKSSMNKRINTRPGEARTKYDLDIVFCIDLTESMDKHMNTVRSQMEELYRRLPKRFESMGAEVKSLRCRLVAFRDLVDDGPAAVQTTEFFDMASQAEQFRQAISQLPCAGGKSGFSSGLEALAFAINSKWNKESLKRRQVICLWSDKLCRELSPEISGRFGSMPSDFDRLSEFWNKQREEFGSMSLGIFAPADGSWSRLAESWPAVMLYPGTAGANMEMDALDIFVGHIADPPPVF